MNGNENTNTNDANSTNNTDTPNNEQPNIKLIITIHLITTN